MLKVKEWIKNKDVQFTFVQLPFKDLIRRNKDNATLHVGCKGAFTIHRFCEDLIHAEIYDVQEIYSHGYIEHIYSEKYMIEVDDLKPDFYPIA